MALGSLLKALLSKGRWESRKVFFGQVILPHQYDLTFFKNIATGETSQIITYIDYYDFHHEITFISR